MELMKCLSQCMDDLAILREEEEEVIEKGEKVEQRCSDNWIIY